MPTESTGAKAADNRLTQGRPTSWLVTYDMAPAFFDLAADAQLQLETKDAVHAVRLALERRWKAAFARTDIKKGWILFNVRSQAEAERIIEGYPTRAYLENIAYINVFNATQAGINFPIIVKGILEYLRTRFR